MWKGERGSIVAAGLDLCNMQIITPDRRQSYKKMFETYSTGGKIVLAAILIENGNWDRSYIAELNKNGFDLLPRCGYCTKADFQKYKNNDYCTLFLLVSDRLQPKENKYTPCKTYERDREHVLNCYGDGHGHTIYTTDRNGYPLPDIRERKKYAHNFFARLRHEKAVAVFDPTTRAAAMLEAKKKIDNLRRSIAYIVLTHADFIKMIGEIEFKLRWDVQSDYKQIERTETAGELETAVKNFNEAVEKVNGILAKYETEKQPATV